MIRTYDAVASTSNHHILTVNVLLFAARYHFKSDIVASFWLTLPFLCTVLYTVYVLQLSFNSNHCMAVWFTSLGDVTKFANDVIPFEFQGINNWVNCITSSSYNPRLRIYPVLCLT